MDKQKIYDTVKQKLLAQGRQSYHDETMTCMYRNNDGARCAVGHLIPDELYSRSIEGCAPPSLAHLGKIAGKAYAMTHSIWKNIYAALEITNDAEISFLADLQMAHDQISLVRDDFEEQILKNLRIVAERYGLVP